MIRSLQTHLISEFQARGFILSPVDRKLPRQVQVYNALGILRRHTPHGIEQVEVVLSEPVRTSFAVEFGLVPLEGTDFPSGHYSAENTPVGWLNHYCRLRRKKWNVFSEWWRVRRWPWMKVKELDYVDLAKHIATLIPEIEQFFENGKCGPHVKLVSAADLPKGVAINMNTS